MNSLNNTNTKHYLNLYFQVHQPRRLRQLSFFNTDAEASVFDDKLNEDIIRKVATRCYQPVNLLLLSLIHRYPQIRITFSISGVALEQMEQYCPAVLETFRMLASTGSVEFLGETYYHSLSSLTDKKEFRVQVAKHSDMVERLLDVRPTVFRNTELIYSNEIGQMASELGFSGVYVDGIGKVLNRRDRNKLYEHPSVEGLNLFLRNYSLSDDIAFRFSDQTWSESPLTAKKFVHWIERSSVSENLTVLGMDYETFGEHQKLNTGILKFIVEFLQLMATHKSISMINPSEVNHVLKPVDRISVSKPISWADRERDLSAWLGNEMQRDAFRSINNLKAEVMDIGQSDLIEIWRNLQTSDHFYYMSTKKNDDGQVHQYFSHYPSPYEAFMNYMNAVSDLEFKIREARSLLWRKRKSLKHVGRLTPTLRELVEEFSHASN